MLFINVLKAIILGIVEGITEWLPISSTGHLILVDQFIQLQATAAFKEMFNVVIQLGAILAVCFIYYHRLNPFSPQKNSEEKKDTWNLWGKVLIGIVPAAAIGLPLDNWFESHFYKFVPIAIMLIIYGVLFIVVENFVKTKQPSAVSLKDFTYRSAFIIGVAQILALMPGTSRSGVTIVAGLLIGCSRFVATEYSFFLSIPVMFGASAVKLLKFFKNGNSFTGTEALILFVGCLVAFLVSLVVIKFLLNYLKTNDFKPFGWYRIIVGVLLLGYWAFTTL